MAAQSIVSYQKLKNNKKLTETENRSALKKKKIGVTCKAHKNGAVSSNTESEANQRECY